MRRSEERKLERYDTKSIVLPSYITNNLPLVASLLASPIILTLFAIRFAHRSELFAEAIPGMIIQLLAIATTDDAVPTAAWLSIVVTALSAGFIGATISYDFDTDPTKRAKTPDFYGYVPANARKRALVFLTLVLFSGMLLLVRCTTIILLGLSGGKSWAISFIAADLVFYLLVKVVRGGEEERGAKRRAKNAFSSDENHNCSYFRTRLPYKTRLPRNHHHNSHPSSQPFCDSLCSRRLLVVGRN